MTTPLADVMLETVVKKSRMQHESRATASYRDPHGRRWSTEVDEKLQPCTPFLPRGWKAPHQYLLPPAKYLEVGRELGELTIAYRRWLEDVHEARKEHDKFVWQCAQKLYNTGAAMAIKNRDAQLLEMAGPGPMSPEFIKAMMANLENPNVGRWPLGLPGKDGRPLPVPRWALAEMDTLVVYETFEGSDTDVLVDVSRYADDEAIDEDAQAAADRLAAQLTYMDDDEDALLDEAEQDARPTRNAKGQFKRRE